MNISSLHFPQSSIFFATATIYPPQSFKVLDIPEAQKPLLRGSVLSHQAFGRCIPTPSILAYFTRPNITGKHTGSNPTILSPTMAGLPSSGSPAARGRVPTTQFDVHDEADQQDHSMSSRQASSVRNQPLVSQLAY